MVSASGDGEMMLLGEAKWSERPFLKNEIELMAERIKHRNLPSGATGKCCYVLFLSSVGKGCLSSMSCNGVEIVTAEDVAATLS